MALVSEVAQDIAVEFGDEFSDTDIASQYYDWTIEVLEEIFASGRWPGSNDSEDITLVDSQRLYTLTSTTAEVVQIWDSTTTPVARVSYAPVERLIARGKNILAEGDRPTHWYVEGLGTSQEIKIGLYPVPNATAVAAGVLKVNTTIRPPAMTSSSTINLPPEFVRVAKEGVRSRVKLNDGDPQTAMVYEKKYRDGLNLLIARFHGKAKADSRLPAVSRIKSKGDAALTPEGS